MTGNALPCLPALPEVTAPLEMWIAGWSLAPDGTLSHGPILCIPLEQMDLDCEVQWEDIRRFPWDPTHLVPVQEEWSAVARFDGNGCDVIAALRPWSFVAVRVYCYKQRRVVQFAAVLHGCTVSEPRRMRGGELLPEGEVEQHTDFRMSLVDVSDHARWQSEPRQLPRLGFALPEREP